MKSLHRFNIRWLEKTERTRDWEINKPSLIARLTVEAQLYLQKRPWQQREKAQG